MATDGELESRQYLRVKVLDVDELVPLADFRLSPLAFEENLPSGTVVGIFETPDLSILENNSSVTYQLVPGVDALHNQAFFISGNQLIANQSFDHETEPIASVRVSAVTEGTLPLEKVFRLQILDVFENTAPKFTSFDGAEVAELNHPENRQFVSLFKAEDPDDQTLSFHLVREADHQHFLISSATGALKFKLNPDFEKPRDRNADNTYEITVLVSDGIDIARQTLLIHLQNNEKEDTDEDGLTDAKEAEIGTNPENPDTDGDGFPDGEEVEAGTDPLDPDDYPGARDGFDFSLLRMVAENDDFQGKTSEVNFNAIAGSTYYFAMDGVAAERGVGKLDFAFRRSGRTAPPSIASGQSQALSSPDSSSQREISWTATEHGMAEINISQSTAGSVVKIQKVLDAGDWVEISESTVGAGDQSILFEAEAGQQYVAQFQTVLSPESSFEDFVTHQPNISVSMNSSRAGAPENDSFANRTTLRGEKLSVSANLNLANSELGEPMHTSLPPPQKSLWWKWTAPADGDLSLQWSDDSRALALAIYAGWELDDLIRLSGSATSQDSQVQLSVQAGIEYAIVLAGYSGDAGEATLSLDFSATGEYLAPTNDNLADSLLIEKSFARFSGSNLGATGEQDEPTHGDTSPPTHSIWWKWHAVDAGILRLDTHGSNFDTTLSIYQGQSIEDLHLVGQNDDYAGTSTSEVEIEVNSGTTYAIAVDGFGTQTGDVELNLLFLPHENDPPVNDDFGNASLIAQLDTPYDGTNEFATGKANEPLATDNLGRLSSVWWKWTADRTTPISATTLGSSIDTILALCVADELGNPQLVESNDDSFGTSSMVWFRPEVGQTYYFAIDGKGDAEGKITLTLRELNESDDFTTGEVRALLAESTGQSLEEEPVRLRSIGKELLGETTQYELLNTDTSQFYQVWQWETLPYNQVLGAEDSSGAKIQNAYGDSGIQSLYRFSGSYSYELAATAEREAWLQLDDWLIFEKNASLSWWERFEGNADGFEQLIQYSTDGGLAWEDLSTVTAGSNTSNFAENSIRITDLLGKVAKLRLLYRATGSSGTSGSWFIDNLSASNIRKLANPQAHAPSNNQVGISLFDPGIQVLFAERIGAPPSARFANPKVVFPRTASFFTDFFDAQSLSNDWFSSSWYGLYFSPGGLNSWIYSIERGWQYFGGPTVGGGWIYDQELEWLWTGKSIYPWMYQPSNKGWVYDYSPTTGTRKFVRE